MTHTSNYEVLIVDDEPGDVELVKLALAGGHFICHTTTAHNGEDAMRILRKVPPFEHAPTPDLILLDLNMPQKGGREVLSDIKSDPALFGIPVVVLTTSEVEKDVVSSYQLGAAGFVTKPIDTDTLFKAIRGIEDYWFSVVRRPREGK